MRTAGRVCYTPPMAKNPAAVQLGRKGGKRTAEKRTPEQRKESARNAARALWENMSPEERTAFAKKRARSRKAKKT
jgi:hypothetical protein